MSNVYYFNVNYICNNNCEFCLSHNTKNATGKSYSINNLALLDHNFFNCRVILNGGEPTLHPKLDQIINFFYSKNAEVVLYSNGRRFCDFKYADKIISSGLSRITIPLHGNEIIHNKVTGKESYRETLTGIVNLMKLKKKYGFEVELKFIYNNNIAKEKLTVKDLIPFQTDLQEIDSIVLSGIIETNSYKRKFEQFDINLLKEFLKVSAIRRFKIEDVKLCEVFGNINPMITQTEKFDDFYFFDSATPLGKIRNYKNETPCQKRGKYAYCRFCNSIMDNYYILSYTNNNWNYIME